MTCFRVLLFIKSIYNIVQLPPLSTVTVTPLVISIGPNENALVLFGTVALALIESLLDLITP